MEQQEEKQKPSKDYNNVTGFRFCDKCDSPNECQTFGCEIKKKLKQQENEWNN